MSAACEIAVHLWILAQKFVFKILNKMKAIEILFCCFASNAL